MINNDKTLDIYKLNDVRQSSRTERREEGVKFYGRRNPYDWIIAKVQTILEPKPTDWLEVSE